MKVSFIGLGKMGFPMAANLLAAGHRVTVYNRTKSKADELATRGAIVAGAPEDCCDSSVIITMMSDDNALEELLFSNNKFLDALLPNTVHLCMSTISVALSEKLAQVHTNARASCKTRRLSKYLTWFDGFLAVRGPCGLENGERAHSEA